MIPPQPIVVLKKGNILQKVLTAVAAEESDKAVCLLLSCMKEECEQDLCFCVERLVLLCHTAGRSPSPRWHETFKSQAAGWYKTHFDSSKTVQQELA